MKLIDKFGFGDIGILLMFFLNIITLKKGESFVIHPNEPYAYMNGNAIECMINSQNDIQCGLTPQMKCNSFIQKMLQDPK